MHKKNGFLLGVPITSEYPKILNLYFVDDTLLFFEANDSNVEVL
jgi:hypothetical protein